MCGVYMKPVLGLCEAFVRPVLTLCEACVRPVWGFVGLVEAYVQTV